LSSECACIRHVEIAGAQAAIPHDALRFDGIHDLDPLRRALPVTERQKIVQLRQQAIVRARARNRGKGGDEYRSSA
jgi:hypothetical protein